MALKHACERRLQQMTFCLKDSPLDIDWDDVVCPICLDFPHNGVLLQCSSHDKGCRPFVCDTDHLHSNCLDRFIGANGTDSPSTPSETPPKVAEENCRPVCPLCRGEVSGWVVVDEARSHLDEKTRHCEEERCDFTGTYAELRKHARSEHPDSRPSEIDPARQLDWENFQRSYETIDVLSTIHSEVPRGVVLGDYVIEYGDEDDDDTAEDEFEDVPSEEGNWWTSCILYQVFDSVRNSRNRRRSRASDGRNIRVDEMDDILITRSRGNRSSSMHNSWRRRGSRFRDN